VADKVSESNHWHLPISPDATSTTNGAIGPLPLPPVKIGETAIILAKNKFAFRDVS
jgi:hypothetical protein